MSAVRGKADIEPQGRNLRFLVKTGNRRLAARCLQYPGERISSGWLDIANNGKDIDPSQAHMVKTATSSLAHSH